MELRAGVKIDGRYVIESLIGEGGMANVYLANDVILHREVAVKILHDNLAKQERFVERFKREAEAVATLIHTNIVEIFDVGEYDGMYFIVMELLEGKTLKEIIQQKHFLSVSETISIMQQVCDGVAVAHQHGIIHRDLKPQNISIAHDNTVKIMDFGIAYQQEATPLTQTNAVMGSVHYLSPEQAKGENATLRTDVYSLGIVMYEMLVGKVPFSGDSAVNIVLQHLREPIPYVSEKNIHIPQSVENIVLKATAKRPEDRYANLYEMKQDLDSCLEVDRMNEPRIYFDIPDKTREEEELIAQAQQLLDNEDSNNKPKKKLTKKQWMFIAAGVGTAVIIAIIALVMMISGSKVEVPDLKGKTVDEAKIALEAVGLELGTELQEPSDEVEVGRIIRTDRDPKVDKHAKSQAEAISTGNADGEKTASASPGAEAEKVLVKKGTKINVYVSQGKEVLMPKINGLTEAEAKEKLDALGIHYTISDEMTEDSEKDGTVAKQSVKADEKVLIEEAKEKPITFVVYRNREWELTDFRGQNLTNLQSYAENNGLHVEVISEIETEQGYEAGRILEMPDYYPGLMVKSGDTVRVVIANGKKIEPEVPEEPANPGKPNNDDKPNDASKPNN